MWRKLSVVSLVLVFAFGILFLSIFRTADVKYDFGGSTSPQTIKTEEGEIVIDYYLPYPGSVLPDNPFWPVKAARDRIWLMLTTNPTRKVELKLLFADKRLGAARILFENGNPEIGLSTLSKAEKYLEEAGMQEKESRDKGYDTTELLQRLSKASLKHYQVIQEILKIAPDEAGPTLSESLNYSKSTYSDARDALLEKGISPTENPFAW
jgi:hypothetical protein